MPPEYKPWFILFKSNKFSILKKENFHKPNQKDFKQKIYTYI